MPDTFDSASFSGLAADADRLARVAVQSERSLSRLTATLSLGDIPATKHFADVLSKPASPETMLGLVQRFVLTS